MESTYFLMYEVLNIRNLSSVKLVNCEQQSTDQEDRSFCNPGVMK